MTKLGPGYDTKLWRFWQYHLEMSKKVPPLQKRSILSMTINFIWWWSSSSGALERVKYSSVAINPSLALTWSDSTYRLIGFMGREFANGPGGLGSIPGRVIPKTLKMVLDTSLLYTQQYKVRNKGKVEQSWEKSSALPTTRCCSYWKGGLLVAFDYTRQLTYYGPDRSLWILFALELTVCIKN